MSISLIDTHCHINFFENAGDIALECEKTETHTIYVTTLPSQFNETFEYVKQLKYIYPSLGFHCLESEYNLEKEKKLFLKNIVKILDIHWQRKWFRDRTKVLVQKTE